MLIGERMLKHGARFARAARAPRPRRLPSPPRTNARSGPRASPCGHTGRRRRVGSVQTPAATSRPPETMMTVPVDVPAPRRSAALLVPLGAGALLAVALGVYGNLHPPTGRAVYIGPFLSMISMKVWLTSAAVLLAVVQLVSALWMYGRLGIAAPRWGRAFHRGTGSLAFILTLPVAFHCLVSLGFATADPRTLAHSLLGCL